jgi:deazaflavin-dependent oxidoreductase (nitroreductase family)
MVQHVGFEGLGRPVTTAPTSEELARALRHGHAIDITTTGRRTGRPRRIEIVFHVFDGRIYISGLPSRRTRAWLHNLETDPRLTFHLKGPGAVADLPATARIIDSEPERQAVLEKVARAWRRTDVDAMVRFSPLIEVTIDPSALD